MALELFSQAPPAFLALLGADGAVLVWLLKFYSRLNDDLNELKLTLDHLKDDVQGLHASVNSLRKSRSATYQLTHEDARKFLHYHESDTDNIKRI